MKGSGNKFTATFNKSGGFPPLLLKDKNTNKFRNIAG